MFFWLKKLIGFWLMPLPFCLTLLVVGLGFACLSAKRARLGRRLALAGLGLLLLFSNKYVSIWLVHPLEARHAAIPELTAGQPLPPQLAACRYVVVLGGGNGNSHGLSATSQLSSSALARVTEAVRLLRVLPDASLIVSGPGDGGDHPTHATMLTRAAVSLGVEPSRIAFIDQARDTEDESLATARIVGTAPFALVTSAWHMPRAVALFRHAGLSPLPCPADFSAHTDDDFSWTDLFPEEPSLERSTWAVRERLGYLWIWLRGKT
jgi:uncharacterized SAM-binding protein YcdF (DUF218 family)